MSGRPLANSYWVEPERLLAGEYPLRGPDAGSLAALLAAGVDFFLDLTEPDELDPYERRLPPGVRYARRAIPDHRVPHSTSQMREIQDLLAQGLRERRRIYLHCRAGIGRTGTVAGCFLVERGLAGPAALKELNRLWRQSARSADWPSIPQTTAQEEYVRRWEPRAPTSRASAGPRGEADEVEADDSLADIATLRDRYLGSLVGLATGDALAAATQFRRPGTFSPVSDMIGGGPYDLSAGAWSDDAAMALCLAESLTACEAPDPADQIERYRRWQREGYGSATGQCVGITAGTAAALAAARWRRQRYAGSHDPTRLDAEPLSRVAPVVLRFLADPARAIAEAAEAARTTCQSPRVLDACRAFAAMFVAALRSEPRAQILAADVRRYGGRPLRAEVIAALARPASGPGEGEGALAALQSARWALAGTRSFRAAVLAAINLGGGSDVVGAMVGALAGAHYGVGAIPRPWRAVLFQRERIEGLADALLAAALVMP